MSRRRFACAVVLLFALVAGLPAESRASGDNDFVSVDGRHFVGPDGHPLLLKGINLGNWLIPEGYMFKFEHAKAPRKIEAAFERILGRPQEDAFWKTFRQRYITRDDIRLIRAMGFNTVRVPLLYNLFMNTDEPPVFEGEGWELIDRLISWCREEGVLVVLDLHGAPGGQTGINHDSGPGYPILFYVPRYQRLTIALWREIARRYRDEPTILGYDVLNEPIAFYHDISLLDPRLEPLYRRIVAAIREVDPHHIVILEGSHFANSFAMFGPPFDDKLAYSYHKFWTYTTRAAVAEYLDFSLRYKVPIWLGESGELSDDWIRAFREMHERYGISWAFWTYKNLDTGSSVVSIRRPPGWEAVIRIADAASAPSASSRALARASQPATLAVARDALAAYLRNIELQSCTINRGYVEALGMQVPVDSSQPDTKPPAAGRG